MSLFWIASTAIALCAGILYAMALVFHRYGLALAVSAVGLGLAALVAYSTGGRVHFFLSNIMVLLGAGLIGWLIGRTTPGLEGLLGIITFAAVMDVYSFYFGKTGEIIEASSKGDQWLQYLSFSVPFQGAVQPIVGVGDLVFIFAAYYMLTRQEEPVILYLLPLLGLEAALVVGLIIGGAPALPFMAVALYLTWWFKRRSGKPA